MYAALPYNFLEYTHMNWNPYKRIAALEAMHVKNIAVLDTLTTKLNSLHNVKDAHSKWLASLENRLQASYAATPVSAKAEVLDAAEQKRIRQREYQRVYYAKQRTKAKQREYAAAYRARKKAEKAAAQAVGGTA